VTLGGTLAKAAEFYSELLGRFLIALFTLLAGLNLIVVLVTRSVGHPLLRGLLLFLANVLGTAWGEAALVEDIRDRHEVNGDASIADVFARTWRLAPRVAWATFWASVFVGVLVAVWLLIGSGLAFLPFGFYAGVLLAVLVGLYVAARWSVILPVIVIERQTTIDAFGRSNQLALPCVWTVVGVIFVSLLVAGGIDYALGVLIADGVHGWLKTWLASILSGLIFSSALVAVSTALYYELRNAELLRWSTGGKPGSPDLQPWSDEVSRLTR
jgi:hypothetical protein